MNADGNDLRGHQEDGTEMLLPKLTNVLCRLGIQDFQFLNFGHFHLWCSFHIHISCCVEQEKHAHKETSEEYVKDMQTLNIFIPRPVPKVFSKSANKSEEAMESSFTVDQNALPEVSCCLLS